MGGLIKFVVILVLLFGGIIAGLRATCMSFWTVPSDDPVYSASIVPTLEQGDLVVLWRLGSPAFADLVRCTDPEIPGRFVIGRILGEQGDRVNGIWHTVFVNRKVISAAHGCPTTRYSVPHPISGDPVDLVCESEEAGGNDYTRLRYDLTPATTPETFDSVVPNGYVFLLSDNRAFHFDSRQYGPLPKTNCPERIVFRLWSARGWSDSERRLSIIH
jgi:signal peptidase I